MTEQQLAEKKKRQADAVESVIASNTNGSDSTYKHLFGLLFTSGVREVAEVGGCWWVIDAVASYQPGLRKKVSTFGSDEPGIPFQIWLLKVNLEMNSAVLTCQEDSHTPEIVRQEIEFTDFPCRELKLYCEKNGQGGVTLMLPGER